MSFADEITVEALDADPYPIYRRLRKEAPVAFVPAVNLWLATRWAECDRIGREPENFLSGHEDSPIDRTMGRPTILTSDGDTHKELRGAIEPRYRAKPVADYIERLLQPIAAHYLDALAKRGEGDLMADYFEPISTLSLARSLGFTEVEMPTLRHWFAGLSIGAANYEGDPQKQKLAEQVVGEIDATIVPKLEQLSQKPDDSTLSHMLHAGQPEGKPRPIGFLLPTIKVTLLGGMQEPGHGAGSILYGLLTNPEQLAAVKSDPQKYLSKAVAEGLRWVAPIGTLLRSTRQEMELGGVTLPAGAPVAAVIASACRDEARFSQAEDFNLHRTEPGTAAFGFGAHYCVGRSFAQKQIELALSLLLERLPDLALLPGEPPSFFGWEFRAPRSFKVRFTPA